MPYSNRYLRDFVPVFGQILEEKKIGMQNLQLEIIDEESDENSIFEPAGVDDVLWQLADNLNHLIIYTERPQHFDGFADEVYEESGLMTVFLSKKELKYHVNDQRQKKSAMQRKTRSQLRSLVLDFEWDGPCHFHVMADGKIYIPIYKKPWKIAENLDIIVPFGYNTVIVKSRQNSKKKPVRDRFDEAFYSEE